MATKKTAVAASQSTGKTTISALAAAIALAVKPVTEALTAQQESITALTEELRAKNADAEELEAALELEEPVEAAKTKVKAGEEEEFYDPSEEEPSKEEEPSEEEEEVEANANGSENADSKPGQQNKNASANAKKNSTAHLHASAGTVPEMRAMAAKIDRLDAANVRYRTQNERLSNRIEAMQAQIELHAENVARRSITPELAALVEKSGESVARLTAQGKVLSVAQVDQMLDNAGAQLDPTTRAMMKNQLFAAGMMDEGKVIRQ